MANETSSSTPGFADVTKGLKVHLADVTKGLKVHLADPARPKGAWVPLCGYSGGMPYRMTTSLLECSCDSCQQIAEGLQNPRMHDL